MERYWKLLIHPPLPPALNMAVDWWILTSLEDPVLRFYRWSSPAVSLGYRQQKDPPEELEFLPNEETDLIVRPSGGGYLYHEGELSYSVHIPRNHPLASTGIRESYRTICEPLLDSARELNLIDETDWGEQDDDTANCLASPAQHEPVYRGSKWQASAQVRRRRALLQQGSIFWNEDWSKALPGTQPHFLNGDESTVDQNHFLGCALNNMQKQLFPDRTGRIYQIPPGAWSEIRKSRLRFRAESWDEFPTFRRHNRQESSQS